MTSAVKDPSLAPLGRKKIAWAGRRMPVLAEIGRRFRSETPLRGLTIGACLHVTTETANLCRALVAGGARVALCASNPLSTQDEVAAALSGEAGIEVFAIRGEDTKTFYDHLNAVLDRNPQVTIDDGGDLVGLVHGKRRESLGTLTASLEETTTGIHRLRAMARAGELKVPVFAVNDALVKFLFDNRYGTGQSTLDGILRATNMLMAGRTVVVCGYGWCGRGFAARVRGLGANVIVTEVDPIRGLEAAMDGFRVLPMAEAAAVGDVFVTLTGNKHVLRREHFERMKEGAILCNSGHFDVEIDLPALRSMAKEVTEARPNVEAFSLADGRTLFVLGEGRLVNLACAEGHPPEVMDMSFATQALTVEHAWKHRGALDVRVHPVPREIENWIARTKLRTLGFAIDTMTDEQKRYLEGWQEGT